MSTFITPLRYPGGKGRLGSWLAGLIEYNKLSEGCYVEPYAGGAGAALYLLANQHIKHIVINDADPIIYAFWLSVLEDNQKLISLIKNTPTTMDSWYKQKEIISNPNEYDITQVGFATFFLNRTNRSGILTGGVVGGKKQDGIYKLDARYNKDELCKRIEKIGGMSKYITLYNLDALKFLEKIEPSLPDNSLIYFDPPYYKKGSQLYRNYYKPEDHEKIHIKINELNKPWLVTYDDCEQIREIYKKEKSIDFSLYYSTHIKRQKTTEIMFYNNLELHIQPYMKR
ncbi:TPA: DNA adenine methylase [Yersinia enterocolitica]